jgi:hypothetical protein
MEIRKIDYNKIKEKVTDLSLITSSQEYINFCKNFWQAKPIFLGIFENNEIAAVVPIFLRNENNLIYLDSGVKLYNEIIYFKEININFNKVVSFIKKNYKFDVLEFSFCQIINGRKIEYKKFSQNTSAYVLDVKGIKNSEELLAQLNKKTRNQIKAVEKYNLELVISQDIESFYPVYLETISRLKAKPKEKKYFYDLLIAFSNNFYLILARKDGKIIGGNLFVRKNNYLMLMFNVSLREYWKYNVNDFLYWEMLKLGLEKSIRWIDFGINAKRDHDQIHFKQGFGAKAYKIDHYVMINSAKAFIYVNKRKFIFLFKLLYLKLRKKLWTKNI